MNTKINFNRIWAVLSLCCLSMATLTAQSLVTGTVTDALNNQPLLGASIIIKGTTIGTTADEDGSYTFAVPDDMVGTITIEASYLGYAPLNKTISSDGGTLDFAMREGVQLGSVVVTAQKRDQRLVEIPISAQAISGKTLDELGARDLTDVIAFIPGASEGVANNIGARQYQLRGIVQQNGDPSIGYYIDDAAFNFYRSSFAPVSRSFDINRVEVLRGPQSTLYGAGAMGGVIRYITNKPNLQKISGNFTGGLSSTNGGDGGNYYDAMLNVPLIKNKLGLRVSGSFESVGGYMETNDGTTENFNDANIQQLRAQLMYIPTNNLSFKLLYQANSVDQNAGTFLSDVENTISTGNVGDFTNVGWDVLAGTAEWDISNFATLNTTTSLIGYEFKNDVALPFPPSPTGMLKVSADIDTRAINHETRLVSNTESGFQWLAGVFYADSKNTIFQALDPEIQPNGGADFTSKSISFFGEASYKLLDGKLIPLLGLRSFSDTRRIEPTNRDEQEGTFESVNPRFNLSFRPNENANYFINVAKGFRSGQFNNPAFLPFFQMAGLEVSENVDSDKLWSYELGTKQSWAEGQFNMEAVLYTQQWKDQQFSPAIQGITTQVSLGDSRINGLDLGLAYSPNNSELSFQFIANVNDAKFKDINEQFIDFLPFEVGDRLPGVPSFNVGFNTVYMAAFGEKGWRFAGSAGISHMGKQVAIDENRTEGDEQTMARMRLGVRNKNYEISMFGNNLLGESGALFANVAGGRSLATQAYPRQLGIELSVSF